MSNNKFKSCAIYGNIVDYDAKTKKIVRLALVDLVVDHDVHDFIFLGNNLFQQIVYSELQILTDKLYLNVERFSYFNLDNISKDKCLKNQDFIFCSAINTTKSAISEIDKHKNPKIISLDNYI